MSAPLESDATTGAPESADHSVLWSAVDARKPLQRAAVLLRYRDGLSYQLIAEQLGKSVSHVGVLLHHALADLRGSALLRAEVLP